VPVGDGWIYTRPFEPVVVDGSLVGRGSSDNKSGVIGSMSVMEMLRDCQIPIKSRIQAFIGSNEESGMGDMEAFVANEAMPDLSLVPDSAFACSLGEKGILRMWAKCGRPLKTILGFQGGNAFNVVLDRVNVTIAANDALAQELKEKTAGNDSFVVNVDADGTIQLQAIGIAKHAAAPVGGVNATVLAADLLLSCENLDGSDRTVLQDVTDALTSYWGEGLGIDFEDSDFGKLTCVNGMMDVEDGYLRVSLDIRYGIQMPGAKLEKLLATAWEAKGWKIVYMFNREGFAVDKDSPIPQMLVDVCHEVTGREYKTYQMAGGTYSRYLKNAFTVGTCAADPDRELKLTPPAGHGGAHMKDEAIDIAGFHQAIRILAHYVITCDQVLNA
jgi:succinyl-diaminopimelate desuccinylase